jgi:translocator protein
VSSDSLGWIMFVAICGGAAAVGSWFTASSVKTWYPRLIKPAGTPASWVFAPVWSALYLMIATAAWLVWLQRSAVHVVLPLTLFSIQLMLNAIWSFVFFRLRLPGAALVEIAFLLAAIALTAANFEPVSPPAFWLMIPYLAWITYATYLNAGIWRLNRGAA